MNTSTNSVSIDFDNSFAKLSSDFYASLSPTAVADPALIVINDALSEYLGINPEQLRSDEGIQVLSGNKLAKGSEPLAMAYAGHQFGGWAPQLGDGRALLLGEVLAGDGERYDIQLKGAGRTPFSRGGDGRNWIGPVLREYVVSEAMHALGVPTTRALAAVTTGDAVLREYGPVPGAILTRVARSHVRVGTFQYFAARENAAAIEQLTDYVIDRHYADQVGSQSKGLALLNATIKAQASLIAKWQSIGFIHGVMNTDNSSITGDTIDYGPCAFMDTFSVNKVFSSIDRGSRYAYQNQPRIAQWNLVNLAQCLLPLIDEDPDKSVEMAQEAINAFDGYFVKAYLQLMSNKLGLSNAEDDDLSLISDLLEQMQENELDFTLTFRQLTHRTAKDAFAPGGALHDWYLRWTQRTEALDTEEVKDLLQRNNPSIIPRNHQVEAVIESAIQGRDFKPFHELLAAVQHPFDEAHDNGVYAAAPQTHELVTQTFCGT